MKKYFSKLIKKLYNAPIDKSVHRFQDNAARLEHINVRNKNKSKKGK